jgi:hypothetical protein
MHVDHPTIGMDHTTAESLSTSIEKNQQKVFPFAADVSFVIPPQVFQVISVEEPVVVLNFLPLKFHLVYTQFTSTCL